MRTSKVHSCPEQEKVVRSEAEPHPTKCRCREIVNWKVADKMVKEGLAKWFVVARERGTQTITCPLCGPTDPSDSCEICKGSGVKTDAPAVWDTYTDDIVLLSRDRNLSTSRTPTIEKGHIVRAYVEEIEEAQIRIEEYGYLIHDARAFVGPFRCAHDAYHPVTKEPLYCTRCLEQEGEGRIYQIKDEPKDDLNTASGRRYDYGRGVLYIPSKG